MKKVLVYVMVLVMLSFSVSAASGFVMSDSGSGVKTSSTGTLLSTGNLTVEIWDAASGGTLQYAENFTNAISNGSWNVLLGENSSNALSLNYGDAYYKNYYINNEDANFTNLTGDNVDRRIFYSPLGDVGSGDLESANFTFNSDNSTLHIDYDNNRVGIGTNNPTSILDVNGTLVATSVATGALKIPSSTSAISFYNSTSNEIIRITDAGNVGIGTTTPAQVLDVVGSIKASNSLIVNNLDFPIGQNITFINSTPAEVMRITQAGKVGIGVTNPFYTLEVVGSIAASGNSLVANTVQSESANISFQNSTEGELMRIVNDGRVGIGTDDPGVMLEVAGNISADGTLRTSPVALATCGPTDAGTIFFNMTDNTFYGCDGSSWKAFH